jgi:hypothetical protein
MAWMQCAKRAGLLTITLLPLVFACSDDTESGGNGTATGGSGADAGATTGGQGATTGGAGGAVTGGAGGAVTGGAGGAVTGGAGGAVTGGAGGAVTGGAGGEGGGVDVCAPESDVHVWLDHEDANLSSGYWSNSAGAWMGWWVGKDETGTLALALDAGPCSAKAARFTLTDSTDYGFGFNAGFPDKCHDLAGYDGLVLWVKAGAENIKVSITLETNNPSREFRSEEFTPSTEWTKLQLPFSTFTTVLNGGVSLPDASEIKGISFNVVRKTWVDPYTPPQPVETFDFWFDDLGVYGGDGTATKVTCTTAGTGGAGGGGGGGAGGDGGGNPI